MTVRILHGDCRDVLRTLPDESVHCCVTSPPYFGLRDYGTASWDGGDTECDHIVPATGSTQNLGNNNREGTPFIRTCGKCGATRHDSQMGLESTPEEYVAGMVAVFREVRRVLRDDGTLWLNIGDSYAAQRGASAMPAETLAGGVGGFGAQDAHRGRAQTGGHAHRDARAIGLKHKDLIGIPWLLAFALRADGWYLRQDIIWSKPNPMPESVTDRCTKAHEYIFLLSKSSRYYYDADAISEPANCPEGPGNTRPYVVSGQRTGDNANIGGSIHKIRARETRNKRSVWTVATTPFKEAHFATFPPALIKPCILAGCPVGGTVLDPFGGAGTTGLVADRLQRSAVLIELNPDYAAMAERRIFDDAPLFADTSTT